MARGMNWEAANRREKGRGGVPIKGDAWMRGSKKKKGITKRKVKPLSKVGWIPITARYPGTCRVCGRRFIAGARVFFRPNAGTRCERCGS